MAGARSDVRGSFRWCARRPDTVCKANFIKFHRELHDHRWIKSYRYAAIADGDDQQLVQTGPDQRHLVVTLQLLEVGHSAGVVDQLIQLLVHHLAQM